MKRHALSCLFSVVALVLANGCATSLDAGPAPVAGDSPVHSEPDTGGERDRHENGGGGDASEPPALSHDIGPKALAGEEPPPLRQELADMLRLLGEDGLDAAGRQALSHDVERFIRIFRHERRGWFQRALDRGQKYLPMVRTLLGEKQIPETLAWLPMIESGFVYNATSKAGARGLWQFMKGTARDYGLEVSGRRDQRVDPYLATLAAREYLLDRVAVYGADSFLLVAAAYNAGEGRVSAALRRLDDPFARRTFIHVRKHLPRETRNYVPQLLAAAIIGSDPQRYGFNVPSADTHAYIQLRRHRRLSELAAAAGTDIATLRRLNDDLDRRAVTTPVTNYLLRVPAAGAETLAVAVEGIRWRAGSGANEIPSMLARAEALEKSPPSPPKVPRQTHPAQPPATAAKPPKARPRAEQPKGRYIRYRVQEGNRLADLAQWFGVSIADIRRWNPGIRVNGWLLTGQTILIQGLSADSRQSTHQVREGESLWTIGGLYGVDAERLAAWNGVQDGHIRPGQKLRVYYKASDRLLPPGQNARKLVYRVREGNYLSGIAELFGIDTRRIKHWNGLAGGRIHPGQKLVIYVPDKVRPSKYKVREGDTLSEIAETLGTSTDALRFINGILNAQRIRAGQRLLYYRGLKTA